MTDEVGISVIYPDGKIEKLLWPQIDCIAIETNNSGPWGADFWWVLESENQRCAYPQGATGELESISILRSRFFGFKDEQLIRANKCTSNARFVCWHKPNTL